MGHLFSRALKRITQGAQPARSQQLHNQSTAEQQDTTNDTSYPNDRVQSIPVGQSIDSSEYAGLQPRISGSEVTASKVAEHEPEASEPRTVEEAAIKIQALVRGHLTRKALKDAQSHSVPPPRNSLGQRQFDEECLLGNVNAASTSPIFLTLNQPSEPISNSTSIRDNRLPTNIEDERQGEVKSNTSDVSAPIAGHLKSGASLQLAEPDQGEEAERKESSEARTEKKKLPLKLCTRASTYPSQFLDTGSPSYRDHSLSPVPSDANVSIDLNYDTPTSASIDIGDHNIRPVDKLASVLHHKSSSGTSVFASEEKQTGAAEGDSSDAANKLSELQEEQEQCILVYPSTQSTSTTTTTTTNTRSQTEQLVNGTTENSSSNYNSNGTNNHEEAAAIRIQSAFRGYRTRKNSPYRTRSPPSNTPNKLQAEQLLNGTSGPLNLARDNSLDSTEEPLFLDTSADISREPVPNLGERRSSRPRVRDSSDRQTLYATSMDQHKTDRGQEEGQVAVATSDDNVDLATEDVCLQSQQDHSVQVKPELTEPLAQGDKKDPMMRVETFDWPTSNNEEFTNDSTEANESEMGTETVAALLGMTTIESLGPNEKRPSVKSDASVETIGSSVAGALLSVDDELAASALDVSNTTELEEEAVDEDKSLGGGVVSLRVDELDLEGSRLETSRVAEATDPLIDQGGALVEDLVATTDDQPLDKRPEEEFVQASEEEEDDIKTLDKELERVPTLDEHEQLTIELESDDIERRDPRGQATTMRTNSQSIVEEESEFGALVVDEEEEEKNDEATCELVPVTTSSAQLETAKEQQQQQVPYAATVDESITSLDSSPASGEHLGSPLLADSSGSSGDDEADEEAEDQLNENLIPTNLKQQHQQRQQQHSPTSGGTTTPTSKNKKRHRNKRKGAKK